MTPEFYEQICRICYDALRLEAPERRGFLDHACAGDASLRKEVETMLAYEGRLESFLSMPALMVTANQLAKDPDAKSVIHPGANQRVNDASQIPPENIAESFAPGVTLGGRYLIEKELGLGGVCAIFLARDKKLHGAPVVIKVLLKGWQQTAHKTWMEKKFRDEIAALARIDHPGVVRALDVGELPDGRSYLVMQYVSGKNLRSIMTPEGMELDRMAKLVRQMGRALAAAHRQGVIHRDLKPENIMLQGVGDEEYVKIIDFGIATIHEREIADATDSQITEVIGTRSYMAPEQLRGKPVAASDIYALGVIVYEMATGRRPFNSESILELYELQRDGVKFKPRDLRPNLSEAAQSMILRALSFSPHDRFARAKDFTDALADELMGVSGRQSPPIPFLNPGRLSLIIALILVAALGAFVTSRFGFRTGADVEQAQTPPAAPAGRQLSFSVEARRDPRRFPRARPFATFENVIFGAGDEARFYISSPQSGHLYVINEGPKQTDGLPNFNVLFPEAENGASPEIRAGQVTQIPSPGPNQEENWLVFDHEEGVEIVWLVWSARAVPELEAVKGWANSSDRGAVSDAIHRASISHYLTRFSVIKPEIERDDITKQTRLKINGETLVWMMKLEHR